MENTIPLETAQEWAARWKEAFESNSLPYFTAFLIPEIDITQVMEEPGVVDIRTYMGIDEENTPRLMIVGVDEKGNDLIDEERGCCIYDFTLPCPDNCNKKAPFISQYTEKQ